MGAAGVGAVFDRTTFQEHPPPLPPRTQGSLEFLRFIKAVKIFAAFGFFSPKRTTSISANPNLAIVNTAGRKPVCRLLSSFSRPFLTHRLMMYALSLCLPLKWKLEEQWTIHRREQTGAGVNSPRGELILLKEQLFPSSPWTDADIFATVL